MAKNPESITVKEPQHRSARCLVHPDVPAHFALSFTSLLAGGSTTAMTVHLCAWCLADLGTQIVKLNEKGSKLARVRAKEATDG